MFASNSSDGSPANQNQLIAQLQGIINQQTVKSGTTAYPEAQQLHRISPNKAEAGSAQINIAS